MKLSSSQKFFSATAAASVLLLTAACGGSDDPASGSPTTSDSSSTPGDSSSSTTYKDGDYEGEGGYSNPGGFSNLKVELTLADNKITDITVTPEATDPTSKSHQADFAGGIADEVVGKSIDELNVGTVAGSSLTVQGFDKALDKIKDEAKA